jgi:hypothetical protein
MNSRGRLTGVAAVLLAVTLGAEVCKGLDGVAAGSESTIYDANPKHLWNRLNETLFMRTGPDGVKYGFEELDPLIWANSQYLLEGDRHQQALAVLDEFVNGHGEKLVTDPVKRACLQHDLWVLFDRTAALPDKFDIRAVRPELLRLVAEAIRRLALTPKEIESLPDNYELSATNAALKEFAGGLFKAGSGWVCLAANNSGPYAPVHTRSFGGRSTFMVLVRFPDGAAEAEAYLKRLAAFEPKWNSVTNTGQIYTGNPPAPGPMVTNVTAVFNPAAPQFPTNTQWALVRRMNVIDSTGQIQTTRLTESIQTRKYLAMQAYLPASRPESKPQRMAAFSLDRRQNGMLRAHDEDERDFLTVHFFSQGYDPFEGGRAKGPPQDIQRHRGKILADCFVCHSAAGAASVQSFLQFRNRDFNFSFYGMPEHSGGSPEREAQVTSLWKAQQFDWGLLQGLWLQSK